MKNKYLLFLSLIILSIPTFAQWTSVNSGTFDRLWVVDFASETNAVIGSSDANGTFLISKDQGDTWINYNTESSYRFYDIDMLNADIGFGCGFAVFMTTEDGGENWAFTELAGTTFIQSLNFINKDTGWIVGFQGLIKRTDNGGESWETQNTGVPHDVWEIEAVNENVVFAVGRNTVTEKGMFFKTANGGLNWETEEIPDMLMSAACVDDQKWYAGGENGKLFYTDDAGENWTSQIIKPATDVMEVKFVDQNNGFLMCYDDDDPYSPNSYIYKTTDAGQTWELSHQTNSQKLYSIAFTSPNAGLACGADGKIWRYNVSTNMEEIQNQDILIYPNPSTGIININQRGLEKILSYEILNIAGNTIHQSEFLSPNSQFKINKKGVYLLKIQTENQTLTETIIIQ
ncbi:MAG: hypothetical protein B7C24_01650 [Bacteroidetes bacterium 4572_77]|nr:MAG: hypothetical protein B7C24_01650 [Bacteroidetes bacterium 4572_77]